MQRGKNRPYLLQMSNYTVYFIAKRLFWARASKRSTTRSMYMSRSTLQTKNLRAFAKLQGGTCPSAPCLATTMMQTNPAVEQKKILNGPRVSVISPVGTEKVYGENGLSKSQDLTSE